MTYTIHGTHHDSREPGFGITVENCDHASHALEKAARYLAEDGRRLEDYAVECFRSTGDGQPL